MKFRRIPTEVNAFRFCFDSMEDWFLEKIASKDITLYNYDPKYNNKNTYAEINTLEGIMKAEFGDYIIKGIEGEIYPCKPGIFKRTYEKL